jgi:hypothetical protein
MMRKIAIGLAAAAIAVGGSTLTASARPSYGSMGYSKGSIGKHLGAHHRFGPRTYGMYGKEEREYGPRRGYERHGYEPLLSPAERERLRGRILSRLERDPLLSPYEKERLRGRILSRLERGEPLLSPYEKERLRGRIFSRLEREQFEGRHGYEPRLSMAERERYTYRHPTYGHRYERPYGSERPYGYRFGSERPYGHRYGSERSYGYRHGYEHPYGYRHGYERPYSHRYGYEEYGRGPWFYGRR